MSYEKCAVAFCFLYSFPLLILQLPASPNDVFLQAVVTYSSTYVLVALSIDRYDAITHPMNFTGSCKYSRLTEPILELHQIWTLEKSNFNHLLNIFTPKIKKFVFLIKFIVF